MTHDVEKTFEAAGAVLHGHFGLTSGRHSPIYWEKFRVIERPRATVTLCGMIADHYRDKKVDVVAGPTTGGSSLPTKSLASLMSAARSPKRSAVGKRFDGAWLYSPVSES